MSIRLEKVSVDNFENVLSLQIHEEQKGFVSSPAYSLAEAYVYYKNAYPFAIYNDDVMVGFIMLGYYEIRNQYTLWKFLIDKHYQNKGYGKEALLQGIRYAKEQFKCTELYTGVSIGNKIAEQLYMKIGFEATGLIENGMIEMCLHIN